MKRKPVANPPRATIEAHTRPWSKLPCPGNTTVRAVLGLSDNAPLGFCEVCGRGVEVRK